MEIFAYILTGCFSGLLAGLLGIGGGLLTVPVMLFLLPHFGLPESQIMHMAIATSLAAIIPTSMLSAWGHYKHNSIDYDAVKRLAPGLMLGSFVGAIFASYIPKTELQLVFALFLLFVVYKMLKSSETKIGIKNPFYMFVAGPLIGSISALLGVGGGTMTVPFLTWQGLSLQKAVGSSALCGLPIAIAGSLAFANMHVFNHNAADQQFIYWPALAGIVIGSLLSVRFGVKAAHRLPVKRLKIIFSLLLLLVAVKLMFF